MWLMRALEQRRNILGDWGKGLGRAVTAGGWGEVSGGRATAKWSTATWTALLWASLDDFERSGAWKLTPVTLLHCKEQGTPLMGDSELMSTVPLSLQSDSKEDEASTSDEVSSITIMSSLWRSDSSMWPLPFSMISFVECFPWSSWEGGILTVLESFLIGNPASWHISTSNYRNGYEAAFAKFIWKINI